MELTLYKNSSERNRINKVLSEPITLTGAFRDGTSIVNPIIAIESDGVITSNYLYIPLFNRYYYIDDITVVRNGYYIIKCSVDVLMSWKSAILDLPVIINKQNSPNKSDLFLNDGSFVTECRTFNTIINFENGFNENGELILITCGKAVNNE